MQFIENNSFDLRSAIYQLRHRKYLLKFVLFPMIHIGERSYYQEIQKRLSNCDLVLFEGVSSSFSWVDMLNFSYKLLAKRLGLVTQKNAMDMQALEGKTMCVDITGKDFTKGLRDVSFKVLLLMFLFAPFYTVYLFLFASRQMIAEHLGTEDFQSRDEILQDDEFESMDELILNKRDLIVVNTINQIFDRRKSEAIEVGIVYGAKHMRSIARFLISKLKYSVSGADWLVVFNLE